MIILLFIQYALMSISTETSRINIINEASCCGISKTYNTIKVIIILYDFADILCRIVGNNLLKYPKRVSPY